MNAVTGAVVLGILAVTGLIVWLIYRKGQKDEQRKILLKSAEGVAAAAVKVATAARKAAHEVESVGPDTRVADGNKLLSGESFDDT